jgi:acyl-CoA reductase-like NAD-dependent aldehyde dehydrogenase
MDFLGDHERRARQSCITGSRLFAHRRVYQQVSATRVARVGVTRLGNPPDKAIEMGTAANQARFDRIVGCIEAAKGDGVILLVGQGCRRRNLTR